MEYGQFWILVYHSYRCLVETLIEDGLMRNSRLYMIFLITVVGGAMGYVYGTSEVRTIEVIGKHIEEGRGRYGSSTEIYVIETNEGEMRLLKFPIIGYAFGVNTVYSQIKSGTSVQVRIGNWPPDLISSNSKPHVMDVY